MSRFRYLFYALLLLGGSSPVTAMVLSPAVSDEALSPAVSDEVFADGLKGGQRLVKGKVVDAYGEPIPGVKIVANDVDLCCYTDQRGEFSIAVSPSTQRLVASFRHYITEERPLHASEHPEHTEHSNAPEYSEYIVFRLIYDSGYAEQMRLASEAAGDARRAESAARARADQAEVAAKARADQAAAAARKEAEKAAEAARKQAEKVARREDAQARAAAYDERYRNKGFAQSIEVGGAFQFAPQAKVCLKNCGWYDYGCLYPVTASYTLGWRVNNFVFLGAGAGFLWNLSDLRRTGDSFDSQQTLNFRNFDVPLYANAKFYLSRTSVQPMVSGSAGYYLMSRTFMWEGGAGVNFRCGHRCGTYLLLGAGSTPWPHFYDRNMILVDRYKAILSVSFKVGFSF